MPQNLQQANIAEKAKMFLFKGLYGTGKSPAAASFPGPIYFFDFDRRISSVKKMFPHRNDIFYDTFTSYKEYGRYFNELVNDCPYKTIVIDSVTNFVELTMDYFIRLRGGSTTLEEGEEKQKKRTKGEVTLLAIDDYAAETRAVSEMLINLKYLAEQDVNTIVTAHIITTSTTNIKTKSTTVEKFLLTYGKKAAGKIPTLFDEIYHFYTEAPLIVGEEEKYLINTKNDGDDFARSSFHMPNPIDWTNRNLYELIKPYFSLIKDSDMEKESPYYKDWQGNLEIKETSLTVGEPVNSVEY